MGCFINEDDARAKVIELAQKHTKNFSIHVHKRKQMDVVNKAIIFAVIFIYDEKNESIYDEYAKHNISSNEEIKILGSDTFLDNSKKKEIFLVECSVEIQLG